MRQERPFRFRGPEGLTLTGVAWDAGSAYTAPQVVFSPGNGFPVQVYAGVLADLSPPATVHGLNPRGHGGSDVPARFGDWAPLLADLRAYIEQRLSPPVVLAGHSLGAMLSLWLAAEAPQLAAGLLLLDPILRARRGQPWPSARQTEAHQLMERTRRRRARWPSRPLAQAALARSGGYSYWAREPLRRFCEIGLIDEDPGGVVLACPPWLELAIYQTAPKAEQFAWAERVRCEAVILRGDTSVPVDPAALNELAEVLPIATVLTLRGGHMFPMEHPSATGRAVAAGLRILCGETGALTTAAPESTR